MKVGNKQLIWQTLFLQLFLLMGLAGCKLGTAEFKESQVVPGQNSQTESPIIFQGISSISSKTDRSATINWVHNASFSYYQIFNMSSGTPSLVAVVAAPTNVYLLSNLGSNATYTYRVRAIDGEGKLDTNVNNVSFTTNLAPEHPSALTLVTPVSSPDANTTPIIRVSGLISGDTARLYSDSSCSTPISAPVVATGPTVDIATSALALGTYSIYANTTWNNTSPCSTATVSYQVLSCPSTFGSFAYVPRNTGLNVDSFCVMRYEAKAWIDSNSNGSIDTGEVDADGCNEPSCSTQNWGLVTHKPVSTETGHPWRMLRGEDTFRECDTINSESSRLNIDNDVNGDGTYALLSNPEYMTLARNLENVGSNWTSGTVGTGCLLRGNVGATQACLTVNSGYDGPNPDSGPGRNSTASMRLNNGEIIWDLSGNVHETVSWTMANSVVAVGQNSKAYASSLEASPTDNQREFSVLDTRISSTDVMFRDSWEPANPALLSSQGIGKYRAGVVGGKAIRGGAFDGISNVGGIYALNLSSHLGLGNLSHGFRCVWRP